MTYPNNKARRNDPTNCVLMYHIPFVKKRIKKWVPKTACALRRDETLGFVYHKPVGKTSKFLKSTIYNKLMRPLTHLRHLSLLACQAGSIFQDRGALFGGHCPQYYCQR